MILEKRQKKYTYLFAYEETQKSQKKRKSKEKYRTSTTSTWNYLIYNFRTQPNYEAQTQSKICCTQLPKVYLASLYENTFITEYRKNKLVLNKESLKSISNQLDTKKILKQVDEDLKFSASISQSQCRQSYFQKINPQTAVSKIVTVSELWNQVLISLVQMILQSLMTLTQVINLNQQKVPPT